MNLRIALLICVVVATAALALVPTPQPARAAVTTVVPTSGWLTQGFGGCSVEGQCHAAVDIAGPNVLPGNPVYAMADGVVVQRIMMNGSYGCYLVIDHGDEGTGQNLFSLYSHLGWEDAPDHTAGCYFDVALGQMVARGQKIGNQGDAGKATGVHLHFGVYLYPGPWSGSHHAFNPTACIGTAASYTALAAGVSCGAETCPQAVADWCLIRAVPSTNIYVLFGGAKFHVPDNSVLASLYPGRPVWEVADSYADSLPDVPRDGTLLLDSSDGRVYVIVGGAKFHIPDETTLRNLYCPSHPWPTCYGTIWHGAITAMPGIPAKGTLLHDVSDGKVYVILGSARFHVPTEAILRDLYCPSYPQEACFTTLWHDAITAIPVVPADGALLHDTTDESVYVIFGGARFHVPTEAILREMYCPSYPQQTCSQDIWHEAAGALPTIPVDDTLLIESGSPAVYAMCQGSKWWIPDPTVFDQLGYSWSAIGRLWQGATAGFPIDANSDVNLIPPGDRQCDKVDLDDDNDTLTDADELAVYVTNPLNPDTDGDTRLDGVDNCANWSNAAQALPVWPVASGDTDCDGFSRAREATIGTSAARQCSATATPNDEVSDSWPTDMDDNRTTNLTDILLMGPSYNKQSFDPGYNPRFDLNADGKVNISDLLLFGPYYNKSCS